ncbi:DUF1360 domain-containing protein [Nocardia donostiensis]|uniref:DUF1360 domain-containing protein n=1 Tax=Nocardia donostiensis TaxID=1538463 RepID=A0A1W0B0H9_9NOCA|nr:DUF1360 domain-containing protein [Nocardia donostiensis]ONM50310.1 hypothetical protein B0T46_02600 [Nocardia donostiensis]OQS15971.1 hypothetical protein B0T36_06680 [Nocardia donostiensis]OQS19448.1 hypothetical protein B0T44_14335 [Nocardia donostiensis]
MSDDPRPLGGYTVTVLVYGVVVAAAALLGSVTGRRPPPGMSVRELVVTALAAHKLSRLATKGTVTAPVRAPFARPSGAGGPGEVMEKPKTGNDVQHSIGELLSCPFCFDVWLVTGVTIGRVFAPRATRTVTEAAAALAGADFLHLAYATAQQIAEGDYRVA